MTQLLLGAGFSHNWGGWLASEVFDYLLGAPGIAVDAELRRLLWKHRAFGGFEGAMEELQLTIDKDPNSQYRYASMLVAVDRMFRDMNAGLEAHAFEFTQNMSMQVGRFLARFDAIFTLNQDLLLEQHYVQNLPAYGHPRFTAAALPLMRRHPSADPMKSNSWAASTWSPGGTSEVANHTQPIYKLHGSSNWFNATGQMMVVGGHKDAQIAGNEVLATYAGIFNGRLHRDKRLVVIGYGFRDEHINSVLFDAAKDGLQLFLIHPAGSDLAEKVDAWRNCDLQDGPPRLTDLFENCLMGVSRRHLSQTFGTDPAEHDKVVGFTG
jgi:hypothetical protein